MSEKLCTKCKQAKPFPEFYTDKRATDGLFSCCKACYNAQQRQASPRLFDEARAARKRPVNGYIPLTKGFFAEADEDDLLFLSRFTWHVLTQNGKPVTVCRSIRLPNGKRGLRAMATDLIGERPGYVSEHADRNALNHRRANLRWATDQQNAQNRMSRNKTGYKGLFFNGTGFTVRITLPSRERLTIGTFSTVEQAAIAYNDAAIRHFGEFACLNVVEGGSSAVPA